MRKMVPRRPATTRATMCESIAKNQFIAQDQDFLSPPLPPREQCARAEGVIAARSQDHFAHSGRGWWFGHWGRF